MKMKWFFLIACVLLLVSCNEHENDCLDDQGFPKTVEENLVETGTIVREFTKKFPSTWKEMEDDMLGDGKYKTYFECFHSLEEFKAGRYAQNMDELPPIDWEVHTLVVCSVYAFYGMSYKSCSIYNYSDKYTVEVAFVDLLTSGYDQICLAVVLPGKNISGEDIKLTPCPSR